MTIQKQWFFFGTNNSNMPQTAMKEQTCLSISNDQSSPQEK